MIETSPTTLVIGERGETGVTNNNINNSNSKESKQQFIKKHTEATANGIKEKSHVRELKRLFESKKSSISSPLKILPTFSRSKGSSNSSDRVTEGTITTTELPINNNLLPPPLTPTTKIIIPPTNTPSLNLDNIISQADRKYYFYVNEAIRKNQPIVPSLAIRRKSIDLTHSPIKGSLYASKYQHSYSPSTRTIQLTKTTNSSTSTPISSTLSLNKSNRNAIEILSPTSITNALLDDSTITAVDNNDSMWIKKKSSKSNSNGGLDLNINNKNRLKDEYFHDRNVSPSRLPVSKSTFDFKFGKQQSKEEPINIKFSSLEVSQNKQNSGGSSTQGASSNKPPKTFRFPFSKGKEKSSSFIGIPTDNTSSSSSSSSTSSTPSTISPNVTSPPITSTSPSVITSSGHKKVDKKKSQHHHSQDNESTHHHEDKHHNHSRDHKTSTASLEDDKPTRLFPWVTLRRIKRSNTADISPVTIIQHPQPIKSRIEHQHQPTPLSTVQVVNRPSISIKQQLIEQQKQQDQIELEKKLNRVSIKQLLEEEKKSQVNEAEVDEEIKQILKLHQQRQNDYQQQQLQLQNEVDQDVDQDIDGNSIMIQSEDIEEGKTSPISEDQITVTNTTTTTTTTSTNTSPKTFVSLSTTILKKDLNNRQISVSSPNSPSSSPTSSFVDNLSPKKYVSVAKARARAEFKQQQLLQDEINNAGGIGEDSGNNSINSLSPIISISQATQVMMSAPSSPTLSPDNENIHKMIAYSDDGFVLDSHESGLLLSTSSSPTSPSSIALSPNGKPIINHRLDSLITSHRTRSASVGSIFEQMTKFEIDDIPPLKVHCSSLEECLEVFAKPDPPHGRCYVLDLGNCGLGDEGLTTLSDNFPGRLEIADLSWNDIGSDGLDNFCSMLRRDKNYIQSLSLMGNSLNPQSIDLLLESIEITNTNRKNCSNTTSKPQKGYKGFGLNLKETGIENEGAEYIAQYIGANKYPNIIGLDLTSSSVTDVAMTELSASLIKTISLTTLILDENYLGDDGAVLLADGLKYNKSLTHLQIRNTDIGERGTIEICNACKFNNSITLLDISLNPWQLSGEISLQSLKILKQQLFSRNSSSGAQNGTTNSMAKIVWKDDGMESQLEVEEILDVVNHFGIDKIIDVLMGGISFSPLVENEKLFEYMTLETKHITKIFQRIISTTSNTDDHHLNSLKLLVALLPIHLRENETFLNTFLDNLSSLFLLLDRNLTKNKVDFLLLDLLDFFTLVIKSDHRLCYEKINESNLFSKTLELFFTFSSHNILHHNILKLLTETTQSTYLNFYEESTFTNDFFNRLITFITIENKKEPGERKANYGHSLEISNLLDTRSNSNFLSTSQWLDFKSNILQKELHLQDSLLCGFDYKNQKLDQSFISKFEKEFKK